MWRHIAANALTFLIVALFLTGGLISWGVREYRTEGPLTDPVCFQVERGWTMRDVRRSLLEDEAIGSGTIFDIGVDYSKKATNLKAGSYLIEAGSSMQEIVTALTGNGVSTCGTEVVYRVGVNRILAEVRELDVSTNRFEEVAEFDPVSEEPRPPEYGEVREKADTRYRMVVAEGVTSWQIVQALNAVDFLNGDVDEVPAEGTLAPDSYELQPGGEVSELIETMTSRQARILEEAWQDRAPDLPVGTPEEALILASIVEKETGIPEERGQVASVFVNRLRQGMRLQTDPTVIYGLTNGEGVLGRGLRRSELAKPTPYNTYVIEGLPPTPIANPGRASIEAALNPAATDFLFFVADGTGGHAFATTLDEHNRNVAEWRRIEAEQAEQAEAEAASDAGQ